MSWHSKDKDWMKWRGTFEADYLVGDGTGITNLSAGTEHDPVFIAASNALSYIPTGTETEPVFLAASSAYLTSDLWTAAGANVYRATGNVGIGTTAPATKLHLAVDETGIITLDRTANAWVDNVGVLGISAVTGTSNDYMYLGTDSAQHIIVDLGTGNVGIGTTMPGAKLDISGFSTSATQLAVGSLQYQSAGVGNSFLIDNLYYNGSFVYKNTGTGGGWWTSINVTGDIGLALFPSASAGTTVSVTTAKTKVRMYVTNTGNVGIGTTNPGYKLDVNGTIRSNSFIYASSTNFTNASTTLLTATYASSTLANFGTVTIGVYLDASGAAFEIPNGAAPVVDATGEIAIDTTSDQFIYYGASDKKVLVPFYTMSFNVSSSSWGTATTTVYLGPAKAALTVVNAECETSAGTLNVSLYDGTNRAGLLNASTTIGTVTYSANNTFTAKESMRVDVGTAASSPTAVSCRFKIIYSAD